MIMTEDTETIDYSGTTNSILLAFGFLFTKNLHHKYIYFSFRIHKICRAAVNRLQHAARQPVDILIVEDNLTAHAKTGV